MASGSSKAQDLSENTSSLPKVQTAVPRVAVTFQRPPFNPSEEVIEKLGNAGTARANIAPSADHPDGTTEKNWDKRHRNMTVLQQHCEFFDPDRDGIIWPQDTYNGFRDLGFNIFLSLFAVIAIHISLSYSTCPGYVPDPFFRLWIENMHKAKHGSDTGTYDTEGRFIPQKFEDFFAKYGGGKDGLTAYDIWNAIKGNRLMMDPFGWSAVILEWLVTYLMLWPEDGIIKKEDVRRIYDGSLFEKIAQERAAKEKVL